jgi:hypothetical protein
MRVARLVSRCSQSAPKTLAVEEMTVEIGCKGGTIGIVNDTKRADVMLRASEQEGAANSKRLPFVERLVFPPHCRPSLTGIGKDQEWWMGQAAQFRGCQDVIG